jgi:hypothetical protein
MAIWNILLTSGKFYDHLVRLVLIWYIFPILVSHTKKNLATLPLVTLLDTIIVSPQVPNLFRN